MNLPEDAVLLRIFIEESGSTSIDRCSKQYRNRGLDEMMVSGLVTLERAKVIRYRDHGKFVCRNSHRFCALKAVLKL